MTLGEAPTKVSLCGLETYLCPHAVLRKGVAEQSLFASEAQGRGRGSTRQPRWTIAACSGAEAGVQARRRARGKRPTGSGAFVDAMEALLPSACSQAGPTGGQ